LHRSIDHRAMAEMHAIEHTNRQMQRAARQRRVFYSFEQLKFPTHSAKLGTASYTGTSRLSISGSDNA